MEKDLTQVIILRITNQESKQKKQKVIGKFKDEAAGKQISHFVGLRAKLYSYKIEDDDVKKAKGILKNVIKKEITFDDYKQCLFSGEEQMRNVNIIRSDNHDINSMKMNKLALSANDDKRTVMRDKYIYRGS